MAVSDREIRAHSRRPQETAAEKLESVLSECSMSASQCGYVGIGREASDETKIARSFARSMGVTGEIPRAVAPSLPL